MPSRPNALHITTDVRIEASDLEAHGWRHHDEPYVEVETRIAKATGAIEAWHNDEHEGAFRWCRSRACRAVWENLSGA
jgi:hypothetical protein